MWQFHKVQSKLAHAANGKEKTVWLGDSLTFHPKKWQNASNCCGTYIIYYL